TINARDAMQKGGLVTLTARNVTLESTAEKDALTGDFVALSVADTGSGIAADILPMVFDPFFTTKRADKGSGLGLSQVHGFAHQSGGKVEIESELGQGTRVTLTLPRAGRDLEIRVEAGLETRPLGGVALIVEDRPDVAQASLLQLKELGYDVHMAGDAEAALDAMEKNSFDLVVSDIVMAGAMDGIALARVIRERHPGLPILLVTGYAHAQSQASAEFAVLRKPFKLADLSRAAATAIAETRRSKLPLPEERH
ncbi:MAG TPA: ATP-binding protein, partial [Stellaceae bacterium]|nr:ATP-binding protein [Stellaceae bacterium]